MQVICVGGPFISLQDKSNRDIYAKMVQLCDNVIKIFKKIFYGSFSKIPGLLK